MTSTRLDDSSGPNLCGRVHSDYGLACTQTRDGHTLHSAIDQAHGMVCWAYLSDFLPPGFRLAADAKVAFDP